MQVLRKNFRKMKKIGNEKHIYCFGMSGIEGENNCRVYDESKSTPNFQFYTEKIIDNADNH